MNPMDACCPECGEILVVRGYKHSQLVGPYMVTDESTSAPLCPAGHGPLLTYEQLVGYERRAVKLLLQSGAGKTGAVMRFARKTLGLKQTELAGLLDVAPETVSRWETEANPAPHTTQLALAALVDLALQTGADVLKGAPAMTDGQVFAIPSRAA